MFYLGNDMFEVRKGGLKVVGTIRNGVFVLDITVGKPSPSTLTTTTTSDASVLLHRRLGHLDYG